MAVRVAAVSVDCDDALVVAQFWSVALDRPIDPNPSSDFAAIGLAEHRDTSGWRLGTEPTWLFSRVPEPKTAKNRMESAITVITASRFDARRPSLIQFADVR